jgi:hypothetical protein
MQIISSHAKRQLQENSQRIRSPEYQNVPASESHLREYHRECNDTPEFTT